MSYDPEQITLFAKTDARGQEIPFGIKAKDRTRHVYVIGKTGMGKSTLLENMAVQDIQNGNGLAFIDPHGQTAETLLNYIPEERKDDVLYFAPFDTNHPVSFNVMEDVGPDKRHLVVSGLMSVFKKIWVDAWSARMEYILSNTLLALLEYPDSTLLGVNRMLSDKVYRKKVIDNISDPAVKSFWVDEFLKYNERYMQEAGDAIKNKIGQFTSNPLIRNIIGQSHSSFDIRQIMDERKILIMNLSKGLVGEQNANLLGSMLTTRIYLAAMSRADLSLEQMKSMPNFYFYVDEFQSFANATFADILSEARKYKLNLTIAHQYIEQMEEEVRNAVFGNVGTIISFRVGPFDAEVLETIYSPQFLAPDIVNLGFAQIYLTLMIDGIGSAPFSAVTLPPIEPAPISYRDIVVNSSRQKFTKPRAEVEAAITSWHQAIDEDLHGGKKNGGNNGNNGGGSSSGRDNGNGKFNGKSRDDRSRDGRSRNDRPRETRGETRAERPRGDYSSQTREDDRERPRPDKEPERRGENRDSVKESRSKRDISPAGKSLDELRSVLKNLSQKENEKQAKKEAKSRDDAKQASTNDRPKENSTDSKPKPKKDESLRGALAAALGGVSVDESSVKKETNSKGDAKPAPKPVMANDLKPEPEKQYTRESEVFSPQTESVVKKPEVKNGDALDPKKLERMMRVTGNDKSPIK